MMKTMMELGFDGIRTYMRFATITWALNAGTDPIKAWENVDAILSTPIDAFLIKTHIFKMKPVKPAASMRAFPLLLGDSSEKDRFATKREIFNEMLFSEILKGNTVAAKNNDKNVDFEEYFEFPAELRRQILKNDRQLNLHHIVSRAKETVSPIIPSMPPFYMLLHKNRLIDQGPYDFEHSEIIKQWVQQVGSLMKEWESEINPIVYNPPVCISDSFFETSIQGNLVDNGENQPNSFEKQFIKVSTSSKESIVVNKRTKNMPKEAYYEKKQNQTGFTGFRTVRIHSHGFSRGI